MSLKFTHKPNYFFFAQTLINFLVNKIQKTGKVTELTIHLSDIYEVFHQDFASTTANLEGILNIADNYHVGREDADHRLIASHKIDGEAHQITFFFKPHAIDALSQGQDIIVPDANSYE